MGGKLPNALGLHDMHGNVWEWCWDWFGSYTTKRQTDPAGPDDGTRRIMRGGSFIDTPRFLHSAVRNGVQPTFRVRGIGFRCARNPRRQP